MVTGSSLIVCTLVSLIKSRLDINHVTEYQRSARALFIMITTRRWLLYEISTGILRRNWYKKLSNGFIFVEPLTLITVKPQQQGCLRYKSSVRIVVYRCNLVALSNCCMHRRLVVLQHKYFTFLWHLRKPYQLLITMDSLHSVSHKVYNIQ